MPDEKTRRVMIKSLQDSLRVIRNLMSFSVEDFAFAIGTSPQVIKDLEAKKFEMTSTQYIAIAALMDNYFEKHTEILSQVKKILDSYGKNYETSFSENSLLKRWFEDDLSNVLRNYRVFLDAEILKMDCAENFVEDLIDKLEENHATVIIPLRSIEPLREAEDFESERALDLIQQLQDKNLVQIRFEESDPDFYNTILKVFERFHNTRNLFLITADEELAHEVLKLNDAAENEFTVGAGSVGESGLFFYSQESYSDFAESWDEEYFVPSDDDETTKKEIFVKESDKEEIKTLNTNDFNDWEKV